MGPLGLDQQIRIRDEEKIPESGDENGLLGRAGEVKFQGRLTFVPNFVELKILKAQL